MWNPTSELAKKAHVIAKGKYPKGYNKRQLIECSKKVYGGFGAEQLAPIRTKPIVTMEDVGNMGNAMAQIDGHYPVGMSSCEVVGINGGCGLSCPVYLEAECPVPDEMVRGLEDKNALELHHELY